jgi:hypothetical protein
MLPASLLQFPIPEAHEITKYEMNRKPSYKPSDDNELSSRTTLSLDNISKDTGDNITTIFIWKVDFINANVRIAYCSGVLSHKISNIFYIGPHYFDLLIYASWNTAAQRNYL